MLLDSPRQLALSTVFLWAFGAASARFISEHSGFALFALSMLVTYVTFQMSQRRSSGSWLTIAPADLFSRHGAASLFGYGVYWLCYAQSFRWSDDPVLPIALNYTWPMFTAFFTDALFRETLLPKAARIVSWLGLAVGLLGVLIVISKGDLGLFLEAPWISVLWGLGAGCSYGFFSAYSSSVPAQKQFHFLALASLSGFLLLAPLASYELLTSALPSVKLLAITIALSILMEGLGYYTWIRANRLAKLQGLNVASITSIVYALPFLAAIITAYLFDGSERLSASFWTGLLCIVLSSALCQHALWLAQRLRLTAAQACQ